MDSPTPLRFGILGAARIAPKALVHPVERLDSAIVTRVAARDRDRAEAFATEHGIAGVSDDYRQVIEADERIRADDRVSLIGLAELTPETLVECRPRHADGSEETLWLNHSYTAEQLDWFRAGSSLNLLHAA